jgi:2-(1,2-epoxy-1,2-dihydrophenyl)acetyl-CoA isomerase
MSMVRYELKDGVGIATLDNQAALNALSTPGAEELTAILQKAAREARAIVLTGAGRAFCSGASISQMNEGLVGDFDAGIVLEESYNPLVRTVRDCPVPVVSAVNGAAAGIGASLALLADLVVAAESAYFLQAFRRIGLIPDGGATWLLPRLVGKARAMEMMLLGDKLPAAKALEWGMINRIAPDDELMPVALTLADKLASGPRSLALMRRVIWEGLDAQWASHLDAERDAQSEASRSADFREGAAAFLEKRPAKFTGK